MKLAALCCTFRRPHTLGQLVESFLRQVYPADLRELVILDDAGQYENQTGEGWRLVSIPARFRSLGEKRNACAALASPDVDGFLVADDDDIYLPHWFQATADALSQAEWSRLGLVLLEEGDGLREVESEGLLAHLSSVVLVMLGLAVSALNMLPSDAPGLLLLTGLHLIACGMLGVICLLGKPRWSVQHLFLFDVDAPERRTRRPDWNAFFRWDDSRSAHYCCAVVGRSPCSNQCRGSCCEFAPRRRNKYAMDQVGGCPRIPHSSPLATATLWKSREKRAELTRPPCRSIMLGERIARRCMKLRLAFSNDSANPQRTRGGIG
jgi:glycosyltransferase involved in cell wall biosynthesis